VIVVVVVVGDVDGDGDGDVIGKTSTSTNHVGEYPGDQTSRPSEPLPFSRCGITLDA